MADSPMAPESQDFKPIVRQAFGGLLPSNIINAVFPLVIYLLASPHMPTLQALALSAVIPLLYAGYGWVRAQHRSPEHHRAVSDCGEYAAGPAGA